MEVSSYELECLRESVIPLLYEFHAGTTAIQGKTRSSARNQSPLVV